MENIVWGAEIAIEGKRPEWLADDERTLVRWRDDAYGDYDAVCICGWETGSVKAIAVRSDHPHYAATARETEFGPEIAVNGVRPEWLGDGEVIWATNRAGWEVNQPCAPESRYWPNVASIRLPATHWAYTPIAKGFRPWAGGDEAPGDWDGGLVLWASGNVHHAGDWAHKDAYLAKGCYIIGYKPRTEPTDTAFKAGDYVVALEDGLDIRKGALYQLSDADGNLWFDDDVEESRCRPPEEFRPATPAEIEDYEREKALTRSYSGEPFAAKIETASGTHYGVYLNQMTREEVLAKADEKEWASPNTSRMAYLNAYEDLGLIKPTPKPDDLTRFLNDSGRMMAERDQDTIREAIKWARENG